MVTIFVAYVDDSEADARQALPVFREGFLQSGISVRSFDVFRSSGEFLENWKPFKYDVVILDIMMGEMTGIELAHRLRERDRDVRIIFCSTSNDFANESYRVDALFYLRKPVTLENTRQMFTRLIGSDAAAKRYLLLPDGQRLVLRKLLFAAYYNHQMELKLENGTLQKTRMSFSAFMALLKDYPDFCACNSGTCINLRQVKAYRKDCFDMQDGTSIPISRRRQTEVKCLYEEYLFRSLQEDG